MQSSNSLTTPAGTKFTIPPILPPPQELPSFPIFNGKRTRNPRKENSAKRARWLDVSPDVNSESTTRLSHPPVLAAPPPSVPLSQQPSLLRSPLPTPANKPAPSSTTQSSYSALPAPSPLPLLSSQLPPKSEETLVGIHVYSVGLLKEWLEALLKKQAKYLRLEECYTSFTSLQDEHSSMFTYIHKQQGMVTNLMNNVILAPSNIAAIVDLSEELNVFRQQLSLLQQELVASHAGSSSELNVMALVIRKQPSPFILMRGKRLKGEELQVQLLAGTSNWTRINRPYVVRADLLGDRVPNSAPAIEANEQIINSKGIASFPIRFSLGSHRAIVNLKFSISRGNDPLFSIESQLSNPFVIITNESQWSECLGALIKKDAFKDSLSIPWPQLANTLQRHFLIATRQDIHAPKRALSNQDFDYLHDCFFSHNFVTLEEYNSMWDWFGTCLRILRFQRTIKSMWQAGVIYGFMSREASEIALKGQPLGSFLIRFAEKPAGRFDIVFVGHEMTKHYLVKEDDIKGAKRSLPKFIFQSEPLLNLVRLATFPTSDNQTRLIPKYHMIHPYLNQNEMQDDDE